MATGNTSRKLYPMELCATKGLIVVAGSCELDGTSDPVNARGDGFSVARSDEGEFVITLPELYPGMVSAVASFEDELGDADDDTLLTFETYDPTTGTLPVRVTVASVLTDFDGGERINFVLYFQKYTALNVTHD